MAVEAQINSRFLQHRAFLGVCLMLAGLVLYCVSDALIKHLMPTYSIYQITFLRALSRACPLLIVASLQGGITRSLSTNRPYDHAVRLVVNLLYTLSFMAAIRMDTLAIVYTLSYTSPFFMILLGSWMLKEKVGFERYLAALVGLAGVLIAVQQHSYPLTMTALLVLLGTLLSALNKIFMRRLSSTEESLTIILYPNLAMLCVMAPCLFLDGWQSMPLQHLGLFAGIGIITALGQYLIAQALRFTQASMLATVDYSTFFWVVALDYIWWDKIIEGSTLLGAALIIGSNVFILYLSRRESLKIN